MKAFQDLHPETAKKWNFVCRKQTQRIFNATKLISHFKPNIKIQHIYQDSKGCLWHVFWYGILTWKLPLAKYINVQN